MMDADSYADINSGRAAGVEKTSFVGNRNDTVNGALPGDKLLLETNGRELPFSLRVKELYEVGDA